MEELGAREYSGTNYNLLLTFFSFAALTSRGRAVFRYKVL